MSGGSRRSGSCPWCSLIASISSTHAGTSSLAGPSRVSSNQRRALAALEVELERRARRRSCASLHEAGRGIDRARSADRDEQVGAARARRRSRPSGRASRRTRRCRAAAPARRRPGRRARRAACRSSGGARRRRVHQAESASPCMCSTRRAPARSCRSSMFWVTISSSPLPARVEPRQRAVRGVGLLRRGSPRAAVVEALDQLGIAPEGLAAWRRPRPGDPPTARRRRGRCRMPLSALIPAPVRITMLRMPSIRRMKHAHEGRRNGPHRHHRQRRTHGAGAGRRPSPRPGTRAAGGVDKGGDAAGARRPQRRAGRFLRARRAREPTSTPRSAAGIPIARRHHRARRAAPLPLIDSGGAERSPCSRPATPRSASPCSPTWCARRRRGSGPDWDIEVARDAPPDEGRRAVGHRAAARRGGGRGTRHRSRTTAASAAATAVTGARAARHDRLRVAARRHRRGRAQRDPRRPTRAAHPVAQRRGPHDLRPRRGARRARG